MVRTGLEKSLKKHHVLKKSLKAEISWDILEKSLKAEISWDILEKSFKAP